MPAHTNIRSYHGTPVGDWNGASNSRIEREVLQFDLQDYGVPLEIPAVQWFWNVKPTPVSVDDVLGTTGPLTPGTEVDLGGVVLDVPRTIRHSEAFTGPTANDGKDYIIDGLDGCGNPIRSSFVTQTAADGADETGKAFMRVDKLTYTGVNTGGNSPIFTLGSGNQLGLKYKVQMVQIPLSETFFTTGGNPNGIPTAPDSAFGVATPAGTIQVRQPIMAAMAVPDEELVDERGLYSPGVILPDQRVYKVVYLAAILGV